MDYNRNKIFGSVKSLIEYCELDPNLAPYKILEDIDFKPLVPQIFAAKIKKKDWKDPILLQLIPREEEKIIKKKGFTTDPVGDTKALIIDGVLQKYKGRALLLLSNKCFAHCRYCFRRYRPVQHIPIDGSLDEKIIDFLQKRKNINEIILSGGEPFTLSNNRIRNILSSLCNINHIRTIRIHTRAPVVFPFRIDSELLDVLSKVKLSKQLIIVLHINHPNEIDALVKMTIKKLQKIGAILLNQAVLLKDINDSVDVLVSLSESLISSGVIPYYLHQLDRAEGTAHFEVAQSKGEKIIAEMRKSIAGYAVPRYVKEIIGRRSKELIL